MPYSNRFLSIPISDAKHVCHFGNKKIPTPQKYPKSQKSTDYPNEIRIQEKTIEIFVPKNANVLIKDGVSYLLDGYGKAE